MAQEGTVQTVEPGRAGISPWRAVPADPVDYFSSEEIAKAKAYVTPLRRMGLVERILGFVVLVAIVVFEAGPRLLDALGVTNWVVGVVVVATLLTVVGLATSVGFDAYTELRYDKRWGFSTQTGRGFLTDLAKGLLVGLVVSMVLYVPLWWVIRTTDLWWIYGWIVTAVLAVGFGILGPVLLLPLFNKFTRLDDADLHDELVALARDVGADLSEVQVSDASRRTRKDNAFVTGMGRTRRLVLFDNLLARPRPQIRTVAAHEIGHWRMRHIVRMVPVALALLFVNFLVVRLVVEAGWVLDTAGVDALGDPGALPLFALVFPLPGIVTGLVQSWVSRAAEREADLFALEATRDPEAATAMIRSLHVDNLADLAPSLWKRLNHSHPSAAERLALVDTWRSRGAA